MELKELNERRTELVDQMEELVTTAKTEVRALTEEEDGKFVEMKSEVERIDSTIAAIEATRSLKKVEEKVEEEEMPEERTLTQEELDVRTFANIIRNRTDDANITKADNGAIIPKTVVNKIIDRVKDISPLYRMSEHFDIRGKVAVPYVKADSDNITVAYATEFEDLAAKDTKLLAVELDGYLAGVLCKVSRSLINANDFDLVSFVIEKMAAAIAVFMDKEILVGTSGSITGLSTATQKVTAAAAAAITINELIELQGTLKSAYQNGAIWVMAPATFTAVKKVLAGTGNFVLNDAIENGFSGTLLGKPVYVSDQAEALATKKKSVWYINPAAALATKTVEDSVQVLNERFATQHAVGIVAWIEADAKVQNQQAVAYLEQA